MWRRRQRWGESVKVSCSQLLFDYVHFVTIYDGQRIRENLTMTSALNIQLSSFLSEFTSFRLNEFAEQVFGSEPDVFQRNKVPNQQAPFLAIAKREVGDKAIVIQLQPGRLNFFLESLAAREDSPLPVFDFDSNLELLLTAFDAASDIPVSTRVACNVTTVELYDSLPDALGGFGQLTGIDLPEFSTDVVFQMNARSRIGDVDINRIMAANVVEHRKLQITISPDSQATHSLGDYFYGLQLTCDFNTVPSGRIFNMNEQKNLMRDLANLTRSAVLANTFNFLK